MKISPITILHSVAVIGCGALFMTSAHAQTFVSNTASSGQGAWFAENNPNTVENSNDEMAIRSRNIAGSLRHGIGGVQFDISSLSQTATSATLSFGLVADVVGNFSINIYGVNDVASRGAVTEANWNRSTATWNTMVGLNDANSSPNFFTSGIDASTTTFLGSVDVTGVTIAPDAFSISTVALSDFINADSNGLVTFLLEADMAGSGQDFFARVLAPQRSGSGSSSYPTLTVIPEPSSYGAFLGLLALASVALCRARRR